MDKLMNGEMLLGGIHSVPRVLENHHWQPWNANEIMDDLGVPGVPPYSGNLKIVIAIAMSLYQIVCPCLAGHQGSLLQGSYPWGGLRTFQQWFGSSHSISWLDWMPVICHVTTSSIN
jgi:hypothetical protein